MPRGHGSCRGRGGTVGGMPWRPSGWVVVLALLAGGGAGLWAGLGLHEAARSGTPPGGEPGEALPGAGAARVAPPGQTGTRGSDGSLQSTVASLTALEQRIGQGAYAQAVPIAQALLATEPRLREPVVALLRRAVAGLASHALEAGRPGEALQWLERGMDAAGDDGGLHLLAGRAYRALGDDGDARYHFERAARFDPTLAVPVADALRALTLEQVERLRARGQLEVALALLSEAAERYPGEGAYHGALVELRIEHGDLDAAAAAAEQALALGAERGPALVLRVRELRRAREEEGATRVPLEVRGGGLYLAVRVNGGDQPLRFLLDTGASHTVLAGHVASALGVRALPGAEPVQVNTANGRVLALPTILASVSVADLRVADVQALILGDLRGADGLLGLSFLRHFHVQLRPETGYLTLRPR